MSKNSEKGRRGELATTAIFSNIGLHEANIEVLRSSTTNTPEGGVDLAIKCPHNLSQKLDDIVQNGSSNRALASTQIDVRIQVKNYSGPINKSIMQGMVSQCSTNPQFGEHWGVGGSSLTKGAKQALDEAQKKYPIKWYTTPQMDKIQNKYPSILFSRINECDEN